MAAGIELQVAANVIPAIFALISFVATACVRLAVATLFPAVR